MKVLLINNLIQLLEEGLNFNSNLKFFADDNKITQHSIIDEPDYIDCAVEQNLLKKFNDAIDLSHIKENKKNSLSFLEKFTTEKKNRKDNSYINTDNNQNNLTFEENNNYITPVKKNKFSNVDKPSSGAFIKSAKSKNNESNAVYTVYDLEFIRNLLETENEYSPNPDYHHIQANLKVDYRAVLVDWLMELCEEFAFKRDTFHYTVNYIDRYLSVKKDIQKKKLQLIGVVALSIASKFEVKQQS